MINAHTPTSIIEYFKILFHRSRIFTSFDISLSINIYNKNYASYIIKAHAKKAISSISNT